MKVTAQINQGAAFELPHSAVHELIGILDEQPATQCLFEEISSHPSSQIRAAVAAKLNLSTTTYQRLAHDPSIDVVKAIAGNSSAWQVLSADTFKTMIRRDVSVTLELLTWLAYGGIEMPEAVRDEVLAEIKKSDDPAIIESVQNLAF